MIQVKELETKEFTVQEVIDAVKENGLEHLRGEWLNTFGGKLTGGCVLGQAAVNLNVEASHGHTLFDGNYSNGLLEALNTFSNKSQKYKITREKINSLFQKGWGVRGWGDEGPYRCGSVIVLYNDLGKETVQHFVENGQEWDDIKKEWYLPTYDDVVKMVEEVLAPYVNEKITLPVVDYSAKFEIVRK